MSSVRLLVGTRKGAFILSSDGKRQRWDISGPYFSGWEVYHLKGSPVDPNRIYASQYSVWFGQIIQCSDDGGKTWHQPGTPGVQTEISPTESPKAESNKFIYDSSSETGTPLTTHQLFDGTQHPWEFKRVWHLEPSLTEAETVYAGVEDASLFCSTDGARTGTRFPACEATVPVPNGTPAQVEWASIPSLLIPAIPGGYGSRSQRRERSGRTMAGKAGSRSIAD